MRFITTRFEMEARRRAQNYDLFTARENFRGSICMQYTGCLGRSHPTNYRALIRWQILRKPVDFQPAFYASTSIVSVLLREFLS